MTPPDAPVGFVMGTKEATPLEFWVAVAEGGVVRLDDVVHVVTLRPDNGQPVSFYGVVVHVRTLLEGAPLDSDTFLVTAGHMPSNVAYAAQVQVTRLEPEEYLPPRPGDPVHLAKGEHLARALHFDRMEQQIPAGMMRNGSPAFLNYAFINGENGAHVNISGVSGVATKTSYALYLLHAILNSGVLGLDRANAKALIFNVKGEDLFFLDKANAKRPETGVQYADLGLPAVPFEDVRFFAPPRPHSPAVVPHLDQRSEQVSAYCWSPRELARDRLFPFLFGETDLGQGNLGYLVTTLTERLYRLAVDSDDKDGERDQAKRGCLYTPDAYGEDNRTRITSFADLVDFLQHQVDDPSSGWLARNAEATGQALVRRLYAISEDIGSLIRGDLGPDEMARLRIDPLAPGGQTTVVDLNKLTARAQMFVVGVLLRQLFKAKERGARTPVFIVLDELNKYAPREGRGPIKDLLVEIAERGRSLGIILIGCQQTASEVERRVVGQAAIRVVGRLDAAEAERPEYNFLSPACRKRALFLTSGTMFVQQPQVPAPLLVNFPFPAYATRKAEVAAEVLTPADRAARVARL